MKVSAELRPKVVWGQAAGAAGKLLRGCNRDSDRDRDGDSDSDSDRDRDLKQNVRASMQV